MSADKNQPDIPSHEFRKRKFPGPAGLLPRRAKDDSTRTGPPEISTQMEKNQSLLRQSPWLKLQQHLNEEDSKHGRSTGNNRPIKSMDIKWVQRKAYRLPMCMKVPFLAAVLENAPHLPSNRLGQKNTPCVKLIDGTGTIAAALDADFVKEHEAKLVPGTALALINVGILRWKSKRGAILTVTQKNVIFITYNKNVTCVKSPTATMTPPSSTSIPESDIESLRPYDPETIMKDFQKLTNPAVILQQYREMEKETQESEFISHTTSCYNTTSVHSSSSEFPPDRFPSKVDYNKPLLFTPVQQQPIYEQRVNSHNSNNANINTNEMNSQDAEDSFQDWDDYDEIFRTFDMELCS